MQALLPHTANFFLLDDNEIACLQKNSIRIFDTEKNEIKKDTYNIDQKTETAEKEWYDSPVFDGKDHRQLRAYRNHSSDVP